jgi:hypothetical protein
VTAGVCRITILDQLGRPQVADVKEVGLWYFPAGPPHSLQGLEPDGSEFVLAFDNGESSWLAHTPPEVLAKNFGLSGGVQGRAAQWSVVSRLPTMCADMSPAIRRYPNSAPLG